MSQFAQNLKNFRVMKNLSRTEMALTLHVTPAAYGAYELGKREPNYDTLLLIAKKLGVSANDLLGSVTEPSHPTEIAFREIKKLIAYINKNNLSNSEIELELLSIPLTYDDHYETILKYRTNTLHSISTDDLLKNFGRSKLLAEDISQKMLANFLLNYLAPICHEIDLDIDRRK